MQYGQAVQYGTREGRRRSVEGHASSLAAHGCLRHRPAVRSWSWPQGEDRAGALHPGTDAASSGTSPRVVTPATRPRYGGTVQPTRRVPVWAQDLLVALAVGLVWFGESGSCTRGLLDTGRDLAVLVDGSLARPRLRAPSHGPGGCLLGDGPLLPGGRPGTPAELLPPPSLLVAGFGATRQGPCRLPSRRSRPASRVGAAPVGRPDPRGRTLLPRQGRHRFVPVGHPHDGRPGARGRRARVDGAAHRRDRRGAAPAQRGAHGPAGCSPSRPCSPSARASRASCTTSSRTTCPRSSSGRRPRTASRQPAPGSGRGGHLDRRRGQEGPDLDALGRARAAPRDRGRARARPCPALDDVRAAAARLTEAAGTSSSTCPTTWATCGPR
ncbi:hypothetical protein NKG05_13590 [Oerskovia sp. M15]